MGRIIIHHIVQMYSLDADFTSQSLEMEFLEFAFLKSVTSCKLRGSSFTMT